MKFFSWSHESLFLDVQPSIQPNSAGLNSSGYGMWTLNQMSIGFNQEMVQPIKLKFWMKPLMTTTIQMCSVPFVHIYFYTVAMAWDLNSKNLGHFCEFDKKTKWQAL